METAVYLSMWQSVGTPFTCLNLLNVCKYRLYSFAKGEYIPSMAYLLCLYPSYLFNDLRLRNSMIPLISRAVGGSCSEVNARVTLDAPLGGARILPDNCWTCSLVRKNSHPLWVGSLVRLSVCSFANVLVIVHHQYLGDSSLDGVVRIYGSQDILG